MTKTGHDYLSKNIKSDDSADIWTLALDYNSRGSQCRHKEALADYIAALKTDESVIGGPSVIDKINHSMNHRWQDNLLNFCMPTWIKESECLLMPKNLINSASKPAKTGIFYLKFTTTMTLSIKTRKEKSFNTVKQNPYYLLHLEN